MLSTLGHFPFVPCVPLSALDQMDAPLTASPLMQPPQSTWEAGFGMEGYVLRGVSEQQRTRSNSTVSAGSMGGMTGPDGTSMACKVRKLALLTKYFEMAVLCQTNLGRVSL